jgi:hypothetical protein
MGTGPSDFELGVLAAAKWLRAHGHGTHADLLLREIPSDLDGTEKRVVEQIAVWLEETGPAAGLAESVRRGDYRQP